MELKRESGSILQSETLSLSGPAFVLGLRAVEKWRESEASRRERLNGSRRRRLRIVLEALFWSAAVGSGILIAIWIGR